MVDSLSEVSWGVIFVNAWNKILGKNAREKHPDPSSSGVHGKNAQGVVPQKNGRFELQEVNEDRR